VVKVLVRAGHCEGIVEGEGRGEDGGMKGREGGRWMWMWGWSRGYRKGGEQREKDMEGGDEVVWWYALRGLFGGLFIVSTLIAQTFHQNGG
jgi:hypothetical protein